MKIVIFSRYPQDPSRPKGGVESVTVVLVRALAAIDDMEVHVVTLESERAVLEVQKNGPITIHRLPGTRWPQILDILIGPGKRRMVDYIEKLKPDIVHTHETYGLALRNPPFPHVFTVHGFDCANLPANNSRFAWPRSLLWKVVEAYGLKHQRHIISITPYVRKTIETLTTGAIYDIDNPVDERFFKKTRQEEPGRILCVGWINERKNTLGAVKAFHLGIKKGLQGTLVIAGEANERRYYQKICTYLEENRIGERVQFLGHINQDQLLTELSKASLFLLPSRQENSPMAIAEAMAMGVPVIASNCCGMPFMVREGESGFLINPEDPDQIADRMLKILGNSELQRRMSELGRDIAQSRFYSQVVAAKTLEVYRQVVQSYKKSL